MAQGLVDAVDRISGVAKEALLPISNDGKSPETLRAELEDVLEDGPTIIFTDLPSGSCALTARVCCTGDQDGAVLFGVNLPILLDFVFHRDMSLEELVPRLLEKGRTGMSSLPQSSQPGP
jgi:mannose/fructose-specific phosphotransferase system component IIA